MRPISLLKRRRRRSTNPKRMDSWIALVIDNHKSTSDGPKNTAHAWVRLRPKITLVSLRRQSAPDVKILGSLCSTAQVRRAPMSQRDDYQEAKIIKERLYQESGKANTRLHPSEQVRQRPGQPFAWHDEGSERVDPKTGSKWYNSNP